MPKYLDMKGYLFGFTCLILCGVASPTQQAHQHKSSVNHTAYHQNHHSDHKVPNNEPGALKNIILSKIPLQRNKSQQSESSSTNVRNDVGSLANGHAMKAAVSPQGQVTRQATGRAILVHNLNDGVKHVVQGAASGKTPVIVINSENSANKASALDPFSQDCLDAHNNYRAKHGVPPLMWSHDLAEGAQNWADQMASTDSFQHDQVAVQNRKIGENLAYFQPAVPKCEGAMVDNCVNCREMVQRWYDEVKNYDFDKGGPKTNRGPYKHFSQLIWANTAELGVGTAVSKRYGFITVARYRPSGNEGDFAEFVKNVPPEGGPLPTMTPLFEDKTKTSGVVKTAGLTPDATIFSSVATTYKTAADAALIPSKATKQASSTNVTAQAAKPPASILAKNTAAAMSVAPQKLDAKLENNATRNQPMNKGAQARGGFVHTLTANDGSKAQVYLSRNGAHAGIVFRNEISRVLPEEDTNGVKRTINVL